MRNHDTLEKVLQDQKGSVLIQVILMSGFMLLMGYGMMTLLSHSDRSVQTIDAKKTWLSITDYIQEQSLDAEGLAVSERLSNP